MKRVELRSWLLCADSMPASREAGRAHLKKEMGLGSVSRGYLRGAGRAHLKKEMGLGWFREGLARAGRAHLKKGMGLASVS
jgi:hypothetical protein